MMGIRREVEGIRAFVSGRGWWLRGIRGNKVSGLGRVCFGSGHYGTRIER
jgi:hypothetical protein